MPARPWCAAACRQHCGWASAMQLALKHNRMHGVFGDAKLCSSNLNERCTASRHAQHIPHNALPREG